MHRAAVILFLLALLPAHALAEARIALLIGNQDYKPGVGALTNPLNDVRVVGDALKAVGFEVLKPAQNATRANMLVAIYGFAAKLKAAGSDAVGFLYYSGHGIASLGENYLIPVDIDEPSTMQLSVQGVKQSEVLAILRNEAPNAAHYLVLDACRNNLQGARGGKGFVPVGQQSGILVAFAAEPGKTASDTGQGSGPYAAALAAELVKPGQSDLIMFHHVRVAVIEKTGGDQVPWTEDGIQRRERVVFGGDGTPTARLPAPMNEAERTWSWIKDTTNQSILENFIKQFGETAYGALARGRIVELKKHEVAIGTPQPKTKSDIPAASITPQRPLSQPSLGASLKIGVAGPLTGPYAMFGAQLKNGAEQAAADINAQGGINGQQIQLVFGDDASDPKQGVSVANKMAADGVKFVIGHFSSGVTMLASEVYQENGTYVITPSATNPKITERGMWNVFRTCGRDDQQGQVAGKYILQKFNGRKIGIIHDKTTYGQGLADVTKKVINAGGLTEVLYQGINIGEKDFTALVSKIKVLGADLVYWGGLYTEGGLIVRQMRAQGVKATLMSGDGITTDEFPSIGGPGVEGTLMTFGPDPRKNPAAAAAVKTFASKNINPEAHTLYSYAALQVIAMAAADAKSLDPKQVAAATKSGKPFKTVIGNLAYDRKGDVTRLDYVMYTWRKEFDGKITYFEE